MSADRLSGLWGPQTPLGLFLMENEITTLFFGGVNADQCVVCFDFYILTLGHGCLAYIPGGIVVYVYRRLLQGIRRRLCGGYLRHY